MQLLPKNVSDGAVKFLEGSIHILTKVDHITWCGYTICECHNQTLTIKLIQEVLTVLQTTEPSLNWNIS